MQRTMVSKFTFIILFGIIIFTNGNPAYKEDSEHDESQADRRRKLSKGQLDEITKFLDELDRKLKLTGRNDLELLCNGNRCGANSDETSNNDKGAHSNPKREHNEKKTYKYDDHERCNGLRCSGNADYEENYGDSLRCSGNRCSRKDNDADDRYDSIDISKVLRCAGDSCGSNRDDDNSNGLDTNRAEADDEDDYYQYKIYTLRCNGRSCSIIAGNGDYSGLDNLRCTGKTCTRLSKYDFNIDTLRCLGDRCGANRADDDFNDEIFTLRCNGTTCAIFADDGDYVDLDNLRCKGKTCSRNRNDYDGDGLDNLRCNGKSCSRNINDDDDDISASNYDPSVNYDPSINYDPNVRNNYVNDRNDDDDDSNVNYYYDANDKNNDNGRAFNREDGYNLRCNGDRCGVNRDDDNRGNLRCIGHRCGRSKSSGKIQDRKINYRAAIRAVVDKFLKWGSPKNNINV